MMTLCPWSCQEGAGISAFFVIQLIRVIIHLFIFISAAHRNPDTQHEPTSTNGNRGPQKLFTKVQKAGHRTMSSTPTCGHPPCQTLYMLIKSLSTSFVLQASSILFAPSGCCIVSKHTQTQTHTGMFKSNNSV